MKFNGQSVNVDWDYATDVWGDAPCRNNTNKKGNGMSDLRLGTGKGAGMAKEIIELRIYDTDNLGRQTTLLSKFFDSYSQLRLQLVKLGLTELQYAQFQAWLNTTSDKEVFREPDYTRLTYKMDESQFEIKMGFQLQMETSDDILLPRGV